MTCTIRLATDADGPAIGALYEEAGVPDQGADWTVPGMAGWWLVAEDKGGRLVGCLQLLLSKPWAYASEVVVHPHARDGGQVGLQLYRWALGLATATKAHMLVGFIEYDRQDRMGPVLERAGWQEIGRYSMYARCLEKETP